MPTLWYSTKKLIKSHVLVIGLLLAWQFSVQFGLLPDYLLPSPWQIVLAFVNDFVLLMTHAKYTLATAFLGTGIGLVISFVLSIALAMASPQKWCWWSYRYFFPSPWHWLMAINQSAVNILICSSPCKQIK